MALMVLDLAEEKRLKAERERSGADRYDEVWEGIYMMAPMADDEHQEIQTGLGAVFQLTIGWPGLGWARTGVNISDRVKGWEHSYRVPDVAVFLKGGIATNHGTFWCGGPDFVIEIVSIGDRTREKLNFYASVGVHEVLLIDRYPWQLELYRLKDRTLELQQQSELNEDVAVNCNVLPVSFRLISGSARPQIEVTHKDGVQRWLV